MYSIEQANRLIEAESNSLHEYARPFADALHAATRVLWGQFEKRQKAAWSVKDPIRRHDLWWEAVEWHHEQYSPIYHRIYLEPTRERFQEYLDRVREIEDLTDS